MAEQSAADKYPWWRRKLSEN